MKAEIKQHIDSIMPDLLAYANYKASEQGCELSGSDILDQAIYSVLELPEAQLNKFNSTPTRAGYNKLDFRIVKRIKFYCKVLGRKETVSTE